MSKKPLKTITPPERKMRYHPTGGIKSKTPYVNGKKHGVKITYYANGGVESNSSYLNGEVCGLERWWDKKGVKEMERLGIETKTHGRWGETCWHKSGLKSKELCYLKGKMSARIKWDEGGNVTEVNFPYISKITKNEQKSLDPNRTRINGMKKEI